MGDVSTPSKTPALAPGIDASTHMWLETGDGSNSDVWSTGIYRIMHVFREAELEELAEASLADKEYDTEDSEEEVTDYLSDEAFSEMERLMVWNTSGDQLPISRDQSRKWVSDSYQYLSPLHNYMQRFVDSELQSHGNPRGFDTNKLAIMGASAAQGLVESSKSFACFFFKAAVSIVLASDSDPLKSQILRISSALMEEFTPGYLKLQSECEELRVQLMKLAEDAPDLNALQRLEITQDQDVEMTASALAFVTPPPTPGFISTSLAQVEQDAVLIPTAGPSRVLGQSTPIRTGDGTGPSIPTPPATKQNLVSHDIEEDAASRLPSASSVPREAQRQPMKLSGRPRSSTPVPPTSPNPRAKKRVKQETGRAENFMEALRRPGASHQHGDTEKRGAGVAHPR